MAGVKACTINLSQRSSGHRFELEFFVNVVDLATELFLDPWKGDLIRKRRHLILQLAERFCDLLETRPVARIKFRIGEFVLQRLGLALQRGDGLRQGLQRVLVLEGHPAFRRRYFGGRR